MKLYTKKVSERGAPSFCSYHIVIIIAIAKFMSIQNNDVRINSLDSHCETYFFFAYKIIFQLFFITLIFQALFSSCSLLIFFNTRKKISFLLISMKKKIYIVSARCVTMCGDFYGVIAVLFELFSSLHLPFVLIRF